MMHTLASIADIISKEIDGEMDEDNEKGVQFSLNTIFVYTPFLKLYIFLEFRNILKDFLSQKY